MSKQQLTPRINRLEPNIIIDGGHEIWPEGTSRSVANNTNAYGSVLFNTINTSSGITLTNSQQASIPSGTNLVFSNQVSKTASGTLAAGTLMRNRYVVEGYDVQRIYNDSFSVIFWVKSSVATARSISLRNGTNTHSYVQQYTISAANTWQLQVVVFPAMSTCPGTVDRSNNAGSSLAWNIVSGSTFQTSTLGSWVAGNFLQATGEETTWLTGTTHDFSIAGVMVLPGDWSYLESNTSAYNFVRSGRNFQEELMKSQRYFEKSYDLADVPGTVTNNGAQLSYRGGSYGYKAAKRAAGTLTIYNPVTGVSGTNGWRDVSTATNFTGVVFASSETNFSSSHGVITASDTQAIHFTTDSRF